MKWNKKLFYKWLTLGVCLLAATYQLVCLSTEYLVGCTTRIERSSHLTQSRLPLFTVCVRLSNLISTQRMNCRKSSSKTVIDCAAKLSTERNVTLYRVLTDALQLGNNWSHDRIFRVYQSPRRGRKRFWKLTTSYITLLAGELCWTFFTDTNHTHRFDATNDKKPAVDPLFGMNPWVSQANIELELDWRRNFLSKNPTGMKIAAHDTNTLPRDTGWDSASLILSPHISQQQVGERLSTRVIWESYYHVFDRRRCDPTGNCWEYEHYAPDMARRKLDNWKGCAHLRGPSRKLCVTFGECNNVRIASHPKFTCLTKAFLDGVTHSMLSTLLADHRRGMPCKNFSMSTSHLHLMKRECGQYCYFQHHEISSPILSRLDDDFEYGSVNMTQSGVTTRITLRKPFILVSINIEYHPNMSMTTFCIEVAALVGLWFGLSVFNVSDLILVTGEICRKLIKLYPHLYNCSLTKLTKVGQLYRDFTLEISVSVSCFHSVQVRSQEEHKDDVSETTQQSNIVLFVPRRQLHEKVNSQ